ncbi:hypothetical protein P692DRAFT_2080257 [Suillus brevipes Sb2]|nr:hypothetical protein P692DRAFT_2080257 [Suillus brevipes Sb2]
MGTRGCYFYRYRNLYFVYFRHYDSYPEGLGVEMLQCLRLPHAITEKQQELEEILDELDGQSLPQELDGDDSLMIFDQRSNSFGLDVEWIYGIDLDRNVFLVNGIPFYSLECFPEPEDFPEDVVNDLYDNLACAPECPPEYKYKKPAAPVIDDSDLKTYRSLACTGPDAALSDLLGINDTLSTNEQVRVSVLEMMIAQCIYFTNPHPDISRLTYEFEFISNPNQLSDEEWLDGYFLVSLAFVPQMFDAPSMFHPIKPSRKEFIWAREDTVICLATHLDNERCLQASMSRLIKTILEQRDAPGDYFGVAFSVSHCAIVKVVKDAYTATFSHTTALQFLPSFFSESPSTPGITALARLGYRIDPALFPFAQRINGAPPSVNSAALPVELWQEIALYLDLRDVLVLRLVSKLCRQAASSVLRYPHVLGHRLVAVSKEMPRSPLRAASFTAERAGTPTTVVVGQGASHASQTKFVYPLLYATSPITGFYISVSWLA